MNLKISDAEKQELESQLHLLSKKLQNQEQRLA